MLIDFILHLLMEEEEDLKEDLMKLKEFALLELIKIILSII